jgi:TRAP-type mannitol/chloroaromatic compound transport system substrate-binding protein
MYLTWEQGYNKSLRGGSRMARKLSIIIALVFATTILIAGVSKPVAAYSVDKDGVIHWTAQSTWIKGPGHQEWADYFTETLNHLCKGKLVIDKMYAGGELIGAFQAIPACSKGKLDAVSGSGYYLTGTLPWISLIIGTAANYMDNMGAFEAWMWAGGGNELYQEYVDTKYNMKVFACCAVPSEALYTVKPVTKKEDFKGLKIRTTGLSMDFYKALGASAMTMPMSEVMPSLERKVLDGAEFCVPYTDWPVKIHEVAPYALTGRLHQPVAIGMEMWINKDAWKALPDDVKKDVEYAARITQHWFNTQIAWKNARLWQKMVNAGLKVTKVSPELQAWMDEVANGLAEQYASKDPWAKRILDSQEQFLKTWDGYFDYVPFFK